MYEMIRRLFAAFARYRPRVLTLCLLALTAGMIGLANSSEEYSPRRFDPAVSRFPPTPSELEFELGKPIANEFIYSPLTNMSYGWPLVWRQYVVAPLTPRSWGVFGESYSDSRLAGNGAIWLALLALPAGICEWLLRRYRPRLRFSLRSMLVVVGLAAALCGWFAVARNRANVQDALIASHGAIFWVERWGPKWLELIGADRYCRRIVAVELEVFDDDNDRESEALFEQIAQLPDLRYLSLDADHLNPRRIKALSRLTRLETLWIGVSELTDDSGKALGSALGGMRRLRTLTIGPGIFDISDNDEGMPRECLAAIGAMNRLEHLHLEGRAIAREDLGLLTGMTNLKSLAINVFSSGSGQGGSNALLPAGFPLLPRLEVLDLSGSDICDDDLRSLAALSKLRALNLVSTTVSEKGLAELAHVESFEELAIGLVGGTAWAAGLDSLLQIKSLKRLHIEGIDAEDLQSDQLRDQLSRDLPEEEIDRWLRAIDALRKAKPELVIDGDLKAFGWPVEQMPAKWEKPDNSFRTTFAREAVRTWKEQQAAQAANQSAANPPAPAGGLGD